MPSKPIPQFVLRFPEVPGQFFDAPSYVGSILDRPEAEQRNARKFTTAADAVAYVEARPALRGATVEYADPVESGGR